MFSKKLDFIMSLTNTKASALGKACLINSSHISRLRNGTRPLPKNPVFLHDMSEYLAKHICEDYQKSVMCSRLKVAEWPKEEGRAADLVERWFLGEMDNPSRIDEMVADISGISASGSRVELPELHRGTNYYYGVEGKQDAVLQFFDLVMREETPTTLFLASDEDIGWLYEDAEFSALWESQFKKVLMKGNRVKIIHNIGRDMNEMLEAVKKWIPVYTTGMIEPYYYPRLRDGVLHRTLFLAPKVAAVTSVSVGGKTEGMLNELITNPAAVEALTLEYGQYMAICRPLMHIVTRQNREELWRISDALWEAAGNMICMSDMPTIMTMPRWVAETMQERAPESMILRYWESIEKHVGKLSKKIHLTEILSVHIRDRQMTGETCVEIPLPCGDMFGAPGLCYKEEEWRAHLENCLGFAQTHPGYRLVWKKDIPENMSLLVKEERGVIMTKNDSPGAGFAVSEPALVNSFWDYLSMGM